MFDCLVHQEEMRPMKDREQDNVSLALLAHDLRTPLSAMRLTAELIGNGPLNEDQTEKLSILIKSIDALTALTGELVATTDAEPGSGPVFQRVSDVVQDCADLFRVAAEEKRLDFEVRIEDRASGIETGHPAELRRVVAALLDNAVKYTEEGAVRICVDQVGNSDSGGSDAGGQDWVLISVVDTGPGIGAEEAAHLFQPFRRGRHGLAAGPGAGLGLWGADRLLHALGGELVLVDSNMEGCRFDIRLPLNKRKNVPTSEARMDRGSPELEHSVAVKTHVLIVDDNDTNCRLLSALLESFGCSYEVAKSGDQALSLVKSNRYDLVLMDLNMPGKNGIETAREIRAVPGGALLPLVAVSAALETVCESELREAGFVETVSKPILPADLYAVLERSMRRTGAD